MTLEPFTESTSQISEVYCDDDFEILSAKDKKEQSFLHIICGSEPEEEEPPEKRRHVVHYTENVFETEEYWNKEASNEYSNQTIPESETFFHDESPEQCLMVWKPSEDAHKHFLKSPSPKHTDKRDLRDQNASVKGSILTSRPVNVNLKKLSASMNTNKNQEQSWHKYKASPTKRIGKENSWPASPIKTAPTSPFKHHLISSPAKCRLLEKYTFSPKKSGKELTETVGETFATLFTQDSEDFCVIAHRDQHLKSPLRDQSNSSVAKDYRNSASAASSEKEEESDLEPEMLFTQDSEGNMVIKH